MKDRLVRGILAGSIAYIPTWTFNHLAHFYFHFTKIRFSDFATMMILGSPVKNNWDLWLARFATMFFLAFCGAVFSLIIPLISSKYLIFKAWFYAVFIWFATLAITKLFKITLLSQLDYKSAISNLIAASIWGITTGFVISFFNKKSTVEF